MNIIYIGALGAFLFVGLGLMFGSSSKQPKTSSKGNEGKTPNLDKLIKKCTNSKLKKDAQEELKNLKEVSK